jgi:hypothetical protein
MTFAHLQTTLTELAQRPHVQTSLRWGKGLVAAAVVSLLLWQLVQLGVSDVATSLPTHPAVYGLYGVIYLLVPLCEIVFFGLCWQLPWRRGFLVFCRKHVYNQEVFDCAGEVYLYGWARKNLNMTERDAFRAVKDNAILSAASANVILLTVPAAALACDVLVVDRFPEWFLRSFYLGPLAACGLIGTLYLLRNKLFGLPGRLLVAGFGIHCFRQSVWMVLASLQWWTALADQSLQFVWTMIVVQQFAGRIPSMPFRDALCVSIGVGASQGLGGPSALVAGVLLVNAVLEKLLSLTLYSTSLFRREAPPVRAEQEDEVPSIGPAPLVEPLAATTVAPRSWQAEVHGRHGPLGRSVPAATGTAVPTSRT